MTAARRRKKLVQGTTVAHVGSAVTPASNVPHDGPTPERLQKAQGAFVVGDDKQGTRIYHFIDTPLTRLYNRFKAANKSDDEIKQLSIEHAALIKYRTHWHHAGLEASVGSVDPNRVFSSDPGNFSGMAKTEAQAHHRIVYRQAAMVIGDDARKLVDNFVCMEQSPGIAMTGYIFRKTIRKAAAQLAEHWGMQ